MEWEFAIGDFDPYDLKTLQTDMARGNDGIC